MVDFKSDMPNGLPQLPSDYWSKLHNAEQNKNAISDFNTTRALEDISIFKSEKNKI